MSVNLLLFNRAAGAAGRGLRPARRRAGTAVGAYRRRGLAGAMAALGARVPFGLLAIDWYEIYETVPTPSAPRAGSPALARADARDAARLSELRGDSPQAIRARFASGDTAYAATHDGRVVGFIWIRAVSSPEGGIDFRLAEDERWAYDLFVDPAHRGRRIGPALKEHAVADLAQTGVRRVLSRIEHLNEPSRRAARYYGARVLGSYAVATMPGLVILHERPAGSRGASWSVVRRSRAPVERTPGASA